MIEAVLSNAWLVLVIPAFLGIVGAAINPDRGQHTGPNTLSVWVVWAWGSFIILAMMFMAVVIGGSATCVGLNDEGEKTLAGCSDQIRRWNLTLEDWQSAVGALLGLFGVAWSAYYRTVHGK